MNSPKLLDAVQFIEESISDYVFRGYVVEEVLKKPEKTPTSQAERVKLETTVWNSFRAVEAILGGEPSKNIRKLIAKIKGAGICPESIISIPTRNEGFSILNGIQFIHDLRDSTASHGLRRRKRLITFGEAMEAQLFAVQVVHEALRANTDKLGRPQGDEWERRFLLGQWLGHAVTQSEMMDCLGKAPEVAVATPGGMNNLLRCLRDDRDHSAAE